MQLYGLCMSYMSSNLYATNICWGVIGYIYIYIYMAYIRIYIFFSEQHATSRCIVLSQRLWAGPESSLTLLTAISAASIASTSTNLSSPIVAGRRGRRGEGEEGERERNRREEGSHETAQNSSEHV